MQKSFSDIINFIVEVLDRFTSYIFLIMFVIVTGNVLCRYLLNISFMWSIDICLFLYVSMLFIGNASAILSEDYLRVELVISKLPKNIFRFYELIMYISILTFGIVILIGSILMVPITWNTVPSGVVSWLRAAYYYIVMIFGLILMSVVVFFRIIKYLKNMISN